MELRPGKFAIIWCWHCRHYFINLFWWSPFSIFNTRFPNSSGPSRDQQADNRNNWGFALVADYRSRWLQLFMLNEALWKEYAQWMAAVRRATANAMCEVVYITSQELYTWLNCIILMRCLQRNNKLKPNTQFNDKINRFQFFDINCPISTEKWCASHFLNLGRR